MQHLIGMQDRAARLGWRLILQLVWMTAGMTVLTAGIRLQVLAGQGLAPWDVLHQGLAERFPITFGQATLLVGLGVVLVTWLLGFAPRWGTLYNTVYVAMLYDFIAARGFLPPPPPGLAAGWLWLLAGIGVMGVGSAWYLSARLGSGPRDGLMLALVFRWKGPERPQRAVAAVRAGLELSATLSGILLGGAFGLGTLAIALLLGPVIAASLPWFERGARRLRFVGSEAGRGATAGALSAGAPAGAAGAGGPGRSRHCA